MEGNVEWEKGLSSPTDFGLCALFSTALWQMTFVGTATGNLVAFYDKQTCDIGLDNTLQEEQLSSSCQLYLPSGFAS